MQCWYEANRARNQISKTKFIDSRISSAHDSAITTLDGNRRQKSSSQMTSIGFLIFISGICIKMLFKA